MPFDTEEVNPDSGDPYQATLRGEVTVELRYGKQPPLTAAVPALRLVRKSPDDLWAFDLAEARRLAKASGVREKVPEEVAPLEPIPPEPPAEAAVPEAKSRRQDWIAFMVFVCLGVAGAALYVLVTRARVQDVKYEVEEPPPEGNARYYSRVFIEPSPPSTALPASSPDVDARQEDPDARVGQDVPAATPGE